MGTSCEEVAEEMMEDSVVKVNTGMAEVGKPARGIVVSYSSGTVTHSEIRGGKMK